MRPTHSRLLPRAAILQALVAGASRALGQLVPGDTNDVPIVLQGLTRQVLTSDAGCVGAALSTVKSATGDLFKASAP